MKKLNLRDWFGIGLVALGIMMLLENFGIARGATGVLFSIAMLLAASYFFGGYARNPRGGWWNIIPAMALLGLASENLLTLILPKTLHFISGNAFLFCLGIAFLLVYAGDRSRWWGIIPGGVLLTLVVANIAKGGNDMGILLIGLGVTFLIVALAPTNNNRNEWAYIPSVTLLALGGFLISQKSMTLLNTALPYALIALGVLVIFRFWMGRNS